MTVMTGIGRGLNDGHVASGPYRVSRDLDIQRSIKQAIQRKADIIYSQYVTTVDFNCSD